MVRQIVIIYVITKGDYFTQIEKYIISAFFLSFTQYLYKKNLRITAHGRLKYPVCFCLSVKTTRSYIKVNMMHYVSVKYIF